MSRIIPARAGQTACVQGIPGIPPDHPRACGANSDNSSTTTSRSGSSPRVRGKRDRAGNRPAIRRIIPARAGQTRPPARRPRRRPDHPRACGANAVSFQSTARCSGSSPRVRGKLVSSARTAFHDRIIPARAGQTVHTVTPLSKTPDHPRACGANAVVRVDVRVSIGSSPRVRGKPVTSDDFTVFERIIPARAGQTSWHGQHTRVHSDHPRACGANSPMTSFFAP